MKIFLIIFLSIIIFPVFAPSHPEFIGLDSPLKQIKAGVQLVDVICSEGKFPAYKYNAMRVACVSLETESQLVLRGWALLRLHMPDVDPSRALCDRYDGNWLADHKECEYISPQQCSLMGGEFSECESACRHNPAAEICTLQCVLVCSVEGNHFPEFLLSYSKEGGFAGITQNISIDTQNHLIEISGFDSKTLGPISTEDMQRLWDVISQNQFFKLDSIVYAPVEGSADYFTYTLDVTTSPQRNTVSWTDTSSEFPNELVIISQEINRLIQFHSTGPESNKDSMLRQNDLDCFTFWKATLASDVDFKTLEVMLRNEIVQFGSIYDLHDRDIMIENIGDNRVKIAIQGCWGWPESNEPDLEMAIEDLEVVEEVDDV